MDTVILKCDSQKSIGENGIKNACDLGLSIGSTYDYKTDCYKIWSYSRKRELLDYIKDKHVVGFRCCDFDLPLLLGNSVSYKGFYTVYNKSNEIQCYCTDLYYKILLQIYKSKTHTELLQKIKKSQMNPKTYRLRSIYKAITGKNVDISANPAELFSEKRIVELIELNIFKLRLIKKIYEYIMLNGYVINGDYDIVMVYIKNYIVVQESDF